MFEIDASLTHKINQLALMSPDLVWIMIRVSALGVPVMIALTAVQWWSTNDRTNIRHITITAGLSFILGLVINQAILLFVHRMRPYDSGITHLFIERSPDFSFPSDHATASFAIASAFLFKSRRSWGMVFGLAALIICLSRVFLGTHYLSDVIAGAFTGILASVTVYFGYAQGSRADKFLTNIF